MTAVLIGLALLVGLSLIRRSFKLVLGLGGGLAAAAAGWQGGGDGPAAPRVSPPAQPRPWVSAPGTERRWVVTDRVNRRTCPSTECGSVGHLSFGDGVAVREERDGWARISAPYDARCAEGRSALVGAGNAACAEVNGIFGGQLAEWVSAEFLSTSRPLAAGPAPPEG